ncbi:hypothetical protein GT347_01240 [Xylophilus rhododendri]|uniref:Uncharacterized protein n=1 Tax=Xylophilus rhododendri TaxID=2697032 RepID=A0A857J1I2_9BURK|nr:hypothetical protein [Xylophilus rhododendri]QHI96735.1 hypothetical protein GT347_01240 [Xylophilus rhododendri]
MNTHRPDSKPSTPPRRRRREDAEDFARTQSFDAEPVDPDLDVTSSGFGGHMAPPQQFADLWLDTSSAQRWRHTLWLALGFGAILGSALTAAVFLLLPGALRAFGY